MCGNRYKIILIRIKALKTALARSKVKLCSTAAEPTEKEATAATNINSRRRGRLSPGMSLTSSYQSSCQRASCSRGWEGILDQWAEKAGGVSTVVLPRTSRMLTSMKSSGFPICLSCVSVQADVKVARENQTPDASASKSRI